MANTRLRIAAKYLECRTLMHAWRYTDVETDGKVYVQIVTCVRCGTVKRMKIDRKTGEIAGNSTYIPPGDYKVEGGSLGRLERGSLRLNGISRAKARKNAR